MKSPNCRSTVLNRATVTISANVYDRRALDSTDDKALVNSLNNLTYLTSSSVKVREAIVNDGAIERLVAILYECKNPATAVDSVMMAWKWVLSLQCLVLAGTRGHEKLRKKLVDAGVIPLLATILDNYAENMHNKIVSDGTTPPSSVSVTGHHSHLTNNPTMSPSPNTTHENTRNHHSTHNFDVADVEVDDDLDDDVVVDDESTNFRDGSNDVIITNNDVSTNIPNLLLHVRDTVNNADETIINAQSEIDKFFSNNNKATTNHSTDISTSRILCDEELELLNVIELIKCIQKLSDLKPNDTTCSISRCDVLNLLNKNFKHVVTNPSQYRELMHRTEVSNLLANSCSANLKAKQNDLFNTVLTTAPRTFENGLIVISYDDVLWSLQLLAFISKYTYLKNTLSNTYLINGLSIRGQNSPPPLERDLINFNDLDDSMADDHSTDTSVSHRLLSSAEPLDFNNLNKVNFDKQLNVQNQRLKKLNKLADEDDKGIIDDYFNILNTDDQMDKMKYLEKVRLNSMRLKYESLSKLKLKNNLIYKNKIENFKSKWDYDESWDEFEKTMNTSELVDNSIRPLTSLNIFKLIERFTVKSIYSADVSYWAIVVIRNCHKRNEQMGGRRQCANLDCGKWEKQPKQFSKCRRCKRAKYCSRECQTKAWVFHKHWCQPVNASSLSPSASASASGSASASASVSASASASASASLSVATTASTTADESGHSHDRGHNAGQDHTHTVSIPSNTQSQLRSVVNGDHVNVGQRGLGTQDVTPIREEYMNVELPGHTATPYDVSTNGRSVISDTVVTVTGQQVATVPDTEDNAMVDVDVDVDVGAEVDMDH